jgi:antitoxin HicB
MAYWRHSMDNYSIEVAWSDEDGSYIATVSEFPGLSAFGETWEEAVAQAKDALQGFIEIYREDGIPLPPPQVRPQYSGQLRLRMPRSLHARLAERAGREGVSLNQLLVSLLGEAYGFREGRAADTHEAVAREDAGKYKTRP